MTAPDFIPPPAPDCGEWNVDAEFHHAARHLLSNSALKIFRHSILAYAARFVTGTDPGPEPTDAMRLGTATHTLILEGLEAYEKTVRIYPAGDGRTKAVKEAREQFAMECAGIPGCTVLMPAADDAARGMYDGVMANPAAKALLELPHKTEQTICWHHSEFPEMHCKARIDRLTTEGEPLIIDLKTCPDSNPAEFGRSVINQGYHLQQAFYLDGYQAVYGVRPRFVFIAVANTAPYEAVVYELSRSYDTLGAEKVCMAVSELLDRRKHDDWSGRHAGSVLPLEPPKWAMWRSADDGVDPFAEVL